MDQIFDRLNTLFKSIFNDDDDSSFARETRRTSGGADSDFDAAMDELNSFLNDDHEETEQRQRQQQSRQSYSQGRPDYGPPQKLLAAYKLLGLNYGQSLAEAKKAWKDLLKLHHPDKHAADPEAYRKATERCARINDAYRIIETWHEHGHLADE
ncbi:MAG: J domain-containing protein [Spirochaetes bacterium]|nr:J domain-containing protein [Spirochaetota bacterium]MBU0954426.1 J domain-containing protein [Spirochaetota bacterium]